MNEYERKVLQENKEEIANEIVHAKLTNDVINRLEQFDILDQTAVHTFQVGENEAVGVLSLLIE